MFLNNLKIFSRNINSRIINSDNDKTYLTISNFNNKFDGLWTRGIKIFENFIPEEKENKIASKILFAGNNAQINFSKKIQLNFMLFKNDRGLLITINNKSFIDKDVRKYNMFINIDNNFEITEKNISYILIEYNLEKENDSGCKKLFVGILVDIDYNLANVKSNDSFVEFCIEPQKTADRSPYLYIVYDSDYKKLKEKINISPNEIFKIKDEQNKKNQMMLDSLNMESDDKYLEKAINFLSLNDLFLMNKNNIKGLFAGYPWFDNYWGRDTFISLTGLLLIKGKYNDAIDIINLFNKYQNKKSESNQGKIPNVIIEPENILYNSIDATCLYIREIYEYLLYTGDYEKIENLWDSIIFAVDKVYLSKKDKNNLLKHDSTDTWMDAKFNETSYSQRGCYAIEIQALWYTALYCTFNLGKFLIGYFKKKKDLKNSEKLLKIIDVYKNEAIKLKESINKYFIKNNPPYLADSLDKDYKIIEQIRPNGLLANYFPYILGVPALFDESIIYKYFKFISEELIFERGVATISKNDKFFHPEHINEKYSKDAAYHNGLIWNWLNGPFVHTACRLREQNYSYKQTSNIINQLFESDVIGTLREIIDVYDDDSHKNYGAFSQAWSVGEFLRSFYQDYLGIRYNLPYRTLYLSPNIPVKIGLIKINVKYGYDEYLSLYFRMNKKYNFISYIEIKGLKINKPLTIKLKATLEKKSDKYKIVLFKILLKKSKDLIRINFEKSEDNNNIKIEDINTAGDCSLINITTRYKCNLKSNEILNYASSISKEEYNEIKTIKTQNFLENTLKNN